MDAITETPFHLVDDVNKSSGSNDFQMSMNGATVKQTVELPDDGTWSMGYTGNDKGSDVLPITISNAKIARVTANLSAAKKAATVTWTVEPTEYINAAVHAAVTKDAKDWTLDEQKTVAEDISANGEASPAYAKAKAAMDAETTWSIQLTDGQTLTYRIIGINHDDCADGSGKAGLTFLTTSTGIISRMNATFTTAGGWEKSELRQKMNSGEIWSLMPAEFQSKVKPVAKLTNNVGGGWQNENAVVTSTTDRMFLLSYSEIAEAPISDWSGCSWVGKEGTQYDAFRGKVTDGSITNSYICIGESWWERSVEPYNSERFLYVTRFGQPSVCQEANSHICICPAWCF